MVSTPVARKWTLFVIGVLSTLMSLAQSSMKGGGDDVLSRAEKLFEEQQFAQAYPLYSQLVSLTPGDADLNFKFGATALYAGVAKEDAIKHLSFAKKKGCKDPRLHYYLGKAYHLNYEFSKAEEAYQTYLDKLDPKDKNPLPAQAQLKMCQQGNNLLANIRDVVVLDKTETSESDFFRYYNLEDIGGRILRTPDELLTKYDKKVGLVSTMHYPGDALTIYFTSYGKDGKHGKDIYRASILPGGSYSTPERLPDGLNTDEDEDFAFMHPDGKTFYFASRGHNSMGGYDIFQSHYDRMTDTFGKPVNLDFAINTPDDDLFYVVDSLKQTAFFASGRNSAQGQLHVYKVMVQSIPVNLMFIAGTYKPDAPGTDVKAKITITDELTGKPIIETTADATKGGYILELPKAGMYRIDVLPQGGTIKHSGVFNVPVYDESVALAQELRIVQDNGVEKLIITNSFEDPLNVNIAEFAAESLRKRSSLDVNVSDDKLRELEEQGGGGLRDDISEEDVVALAGFNTNMSLDEVMEMMDQSSTESKQMTDRLGKQSGQFLTEAAAERERANQLLAEANQLLDGADKEDAARYVKMREEYNQLVLEANSAARKARNLTESAKAVHNNHLELKNSTADKSKRSIELKSLLEQSDYNAAVELLTSFYNEVNARESKLPAAAVALQNEIDEAGRSVSALNGRMDDLQTEKVQLETRRKQIERERAVAKKKNAIAALDEDQADVEQNLKSVEEDIQSRNKKLIATGKLKDDLQTRYNLIVEAASNDPKSATTAFSPERLAQLEADIQQSEAQIALVIDEVEESMLVAQNDGSRRIELEKLPVISAESASAGIDLKPVRTLRDDYDAAALKLTERSVASPTQELVLKELEISRVNDQIVFLKAIDRRKLSDDERQWVDRELAEATSWKSELTTSLASKSQTAEVTRESVDAYLKTNYAAAFDPANTQKGADLEALQLTISEMRRAGKEIDDEVLALAEAILKADDAAEAETLHEERRLLKAARERINDDTLFNSVKVAWENDQRAIIEDDENFISRLNRQIELTETYIETLEELQSSAEQEGNSQGALAITNQLNVAQTKLRSQQQELELAISVSDTAQTDDEASTPLERANSQALELSKEDEIAALVKRIDATDDESERDRLQREIALLTAPSASKSNADELVMKPVTNEASAYAKIDLAMIEMGTATTSEELKLFNEVKEKLAYDEQFMSAQQMVERHDARIEDLDEQLSQETGKSALKRLDRVREDEFVERGKAKVDRSERAMVLTTRLYAENQEAIKTGWEQVKFSSAKRKLVGTHLALEQRKAENAINEAVSLRVDNKKEKDMIRKGDQFEEALSLELEALEIQERLQTIIGLEAELETLSDEDLKAVLDGSLTLEDALNPRIADADGQSANEGDASESVDAKEEQRLSDENANDVLADLNEESSSEEDTSTGRSEAISDDQSAEAEAYLEEVRAKVKLPEVEIAEADASPMYEESASLGDLNELEAQRRTIIESRNAVVRDIKSLKSRIENLEQAILQSGSQAEREGFAAELQTLYRNAEIRYAELAEADERLDKVEMKLESRMAEVINLGKRGETSDSAALTPESSNIDIKEDVDNQSEEGLDETRVEQDSDGDSRASDDESRNDNAAVAANVVKSTVTTPEEDRAFLDAAVRSEREKARAYKEEVAKYYFALPEVLIESYFTMTDENIYSNDRPIPIDVEMPSGIVYKVQVGAFRNPIPQDHFNRFAPLAGERLANGITRYTAGIFIGFNDANVAKNSIRQMGYSDAFVVAYRDGKRISLNEARELEGDQAPVATRFTNANEVAEAARQRNETANARPSGGDAEKTADTRSSNTTATADIAPDTNGNKAVVPEFAENWIDSEGAWLTVQIGVYSKPVTLSDLYNVSNVMAEQLDRGMIRYTTGKFDELNAAVAAKERAKTAGISDAFVTAYLNGKRVSLAEVEAYLKSNAPTQAAPKEQAKEQFNIRIGGFDGKVPAETARALLMLESKWGIYQVTEGGATIYLSRTMNSRAEAQRAADEFIELGAEKVSVVSKNR